MRGITEERLLQIYKYPVDNEVSGEALLAHLISECQEINPWKLIDANTPKGRTLLLHCYGHVVFGKYNESCDQWLDMYGNVQTPTFWKELPENPA